MSSRETRTNKKLKELIVYVASQCADDGTFGETKLNKILFLADFYYFLKAQKSISGVTYVHQPYGPVPNEMKAILGSMQGKDIGVSIVQSGPYIRKRIVALREPNLSSFEPEMIGFLTSIINNVCIENQVNATDLSNFSHDFLGWKLTSNGEEIPYESVFLKRASKQKLTPELIERGRQIYQTLQPSSVHGSETIST